MDFDSAYGAQCVDLFRQYVKDVWNLPQLPPVKGAKDFAKEHSNTKIKFLKHNKNQSYSKGDVLIWDSTLANPYGHIAIYIDMIDDCYLVFEQDGFKQDGAKLNLRSGSNLMGALFV